MSVSRSAIEFSSGAGGRLRYMDDETREFIENTRRFGGGIPESAVEEAKAAGIPIPFHTIEGDLAHLTGGYIEIRIQFASAPLDSTLDTVRNTLYRLTGDPAAVIADSLHVVRNYDPREWKGQPPRRRT